MITSPVAARASTTALTPGAVSAHATYGPAARRSEGCAPGATASVRTAPPASWTRTVRPIALHSSPIVAAKPVPPATWTPRAEVE